MKNAFIFTEKADSVFQTIKFLFFLFPISPALSTITELIRDTH